MIKQRVFKRASIFLRLLFCLALAAGGMALAGTGKVFAADGDENWQEGFTLDGVAGTVNDILRAPDGSIYVGGSFSAAGDTAVQNIARWDGKTWNALGDGILQNGVMVITLDSSGYLYAGLAEYNPGDQGQVRKWGGSTWTNVGSELGGSVYALAINSTGKICAGGDLTPAGQWRFLHSPGLF